MNGFLQSPAPASVIGIGFAFQISSAYSQIVGTVANANGDNRIAIIIPCHRVIGSNGKLVGYGGGLWRKKYLLNLEGVDVS